MLYTIGRSPFLQEAGFANYIKHVTCNDVVICWGEGVLAVLANTVAVQLLLQSVTHEPIYAIEADLCARGLLGRIATGIQLIDYEQWVDLTVRYTPQFPW